MVTHSGVVLLSSCVHDVKHYLVASKHYRLSIRVDFGRLVIVQELWHQQQTRTSRERRPPTVWIQGRNHGWKVEGGKVWVPTPGRLRPAPGQSPDWVLGAGEGRPLPLWGSGGFIPGKFLKTHMLNPAFWWLLAVKFCCFFKLRPRSWGTNTLLVPQLSWETSPYGCCAYMWILSESWVRIRIIYRIQLELPCPKTHLWWNFHEDLISSFTWS